jgi:hypothetical protein
VTRRKAQMYAAATSLIATATSAAVVVALPQTAAAGISSARACGSITFEAQTENGASDIRAAGTTCKTARRVARASRNHGPYREPYRFSAAGFACRGRLDDSILPVVYWRCARGQAVVKFVR